jgi:quercetin dioxygenase-like cupin family protein
LDEKNVYNMEWEPMPVTGFAGKPLMTHKNGGLKVVRIQPGAEFPLHQHPDKTEFAYVLEGTLETTIGEKIYTGKTGSFYQFPVGVSHRLKNPAESETVVLVGSLKDEQEI